MNAFSNLLFINSLICLLLPLSLFAEDAPILSIGESLPSIILTDQFGKDAPIDSEIEKVIFIADMDASKLTHPLFEEKGEAYLNKYHAALISDIHRMPFMISKFIALPKMRDYGYRIRLIREEKIGDPFPRTKGQVTLLSLKAGKLTNIQFAKSTGEVQMFIETQAMLNGKDKEVKK